MRRMQDWQGKFVLGVAVWLLSAGTCFAEDYRITIKEHRFEPQELKIPSGQKVKIAVDNQDATPEEFESFELNREKVVTGHSVIHVFVGPLRPGRYPYFGDFNRQTAQGVIVAEEGK